MSKIDGTIFDAVVATNTTIEPPIFNLVLLRINRLYAARAKRNLKTSSDDFKYLRDRALQDYDCDNLFDYVPYKTAVGKYYAQRRKKIAQSKTADQLRRNAEPGQIHEVTKQSVSMRASTEVEITFFALKPTGKLSFADIDTGRRRKVWHGNNRGLNSDVYLACKRRALSILNHHRGF